MIYNRTPLILIVDDSALNRQVLTLLLKKAGYLTVEAGSGEECRKLAREHKPDLVLLDIMMPKEDGFTTCIKLKSDPQTREIPIIFISALDDTENIVKGLEVGGVDYIVKPFSQPEVLARVKVHLSLKFAQEKLIESQAQKLADIKQVQKSFLVLPEELPEAKFYYLYKPVLELGGDFLDVIPVGENSFAYIVADISGHDLGTAYLISALKALFNQNINAFTPMEDSLRMINAVLRRIFKEGQYLTANVALIERNKLKLSIFNTGHLPAILSKKNGEILEINGEGDILGGFEHFQVQEEVIVVEKGDRVFLFTDGLIEKFRGPGRQRKEGLNLLKRNIAKFNKFDLDEVVRRVVNSLCSGQNKSEDDVILLATEV
ncbi:response regulator [Desulfohalobiaceae bacterium Ax17]|uniref:SpoIIE family protein phosphatase n=1 Tax=Desulfovulcanus ferrireducens TaxID=2831190 RepID=UPI00207BAC57|nr:SpoIIE family protein phosphatase [Desulfovulcanus ferrireducens]MBT8762499.1 response regulator [Desulfovulcanus ferrireducens]